MFVVLLAAIGCGPPDLPESSYFDERVQPLLATSCVRQNTGCHLGTPEGISEFLKNAPGFFFTPA